MERLDHAARERILAILRAGQDLTLATMRPDGYPQATSVSYASDGLLLYAAVGLDSQKAHNIQHSPHVSLTVNLPYQDWHHIRGISAAAHATILHGIDELQHITAALTHKFPQLRETLPSETAIPWGSILFLRIAPTVISLLDYSLGFGHTELYEIRPEDLPPVAAP
jgi:general stress protein 26